MKIKDSLYHSYLCLSTVPVQSVSDKFYVMSEKYYCLLIFIGFFIYYFKLWHLKGNSNLQVYKTFLIIISYAYKFSVT